MAKLRTKKTPDELSSEELVETLLVETGTAGTLPTDEKQMLAYLELGQLSFDFVSELDFLGVALPRNGELRAALSLNDRVVATQTGMGEKRTRFCTFHEIAHCVLPEHHDLIFVDTDQTMNWWTKQRLEREANQFAADLLFQGDRFTNEAAAQALSLRTAVDLAPEYGASFEAGFRRYVERHMLPCALIVYDKVAPQDETFVDDDEYRPHYTITSPSFRDRYFGGQITGDKVAASELHKGARRTGIVEGDVRIEGDNHESWRFATEVFSNSYKIFQFLQRPLKPR